LKTEYVALFLNPEINFSKKISHNQQGKAEDEMNYLYAVNVCKNLEQKCQEQLTKYRTQAVA
jgi:hypothetical protein